MLDTRHWLVATLAMTTCLWMPYVLYRFVRLGIPRTLGNPDPNDATQNAAWATRAKAAHTNATENLVVFAPLALLAIQLDVGATLLAITASSTYFFSRLSHYLLYASGVPVARTLAFLVGYGAQLALALACIRGAA